MPKRVGIDVNGKIADARMPMFLLGAVPEEAKEAQLAPSSLSPPSCVLK